MPVTLSAENQRALVALASKIRQAETEIKRAESAGLDVTDHRAVLEEAVRLRDGLLRTYGPGASSS